MAELTRESEKQQIYKTIWAIANDLRGAVDGWDFKAYVLGMMAYRYLSEHLAGYLNKTEREAGAEDFDYALLTDEEAALPQSEIDDIITVKGYFLKPSELFENIEKRCDEDTDLNSTLKNAFAAIEKSAEGTQSAAMFEGLFSDMDLNSNKLGADTDTRNKRLRKILHAIAGMKLGDYSETRILDYGSMNNDVFGDAYEYLMAMYASSAGKSGGEFYTPQEVAELLALIVTENGTKNPMSCYDPTCGSGGLLLKFIKILGNGNGLRRLFGQEINITTYNLCRINMLLHGVNFGNMAICCGDTLAAPDPRLDNEKPFDAIVSNPPYSVRWAGEDDTRLANDPRFAGPGKLAPKSRADLAFVMHSLNWLAEDGIAAIVCFPGVLYRTGAEAKIREWLVEQGHIDAIIQLPEKLFFGAGIATSIVVLKKGLSDGKTLFIDASGEFVPSTNQNKLGPDNIERIVKALLERKDIGHFAALVDKDRIKANDYNLSVSIYVEKADDREKIDIGELNKRIGETVLRESALRDDINAIVDMLEKRRAAI